MGCCQGSQTIWQTAKTEENGRWYSRAFSKSGRYVWDWRLRKASFASWLLSRTLGFTFKCIVWGLVNNNTANKNQRTGHKVSPTAGQRIFSSRVFSSVYVHFEKRQGPTLETLDYTICIGSTHCGHSSYIGVTLGLRTLQYV